VTSLGYAQFISFVSLLEDMQLNKSHSLHT